ncbi:hypothetical protein IW262DRAFT_1299342 [Armillaria fumosa]|nr:hypothetical protein IW262DRAFT_1299342 [Armillaria fumosa]
MLSNGEVSEASACQATGIRLLGVEQLQVDLFLRIRDLNTVKEVATATYQSPARCASPIVSRSIASHSLSPDRIFLPIAKLSNSEWIEREGNDVIAGTGYLFLPVYDVVVGRCSYCPRIRVVIKDAQAKRHAYNLNNLKFSYFLVVVYIRQCLKLQSMHQSLVQHTVCDPSPKIAPYESTDPQLGYGEAVVLFCQGKAISSALTAGIA